MSANASQTTATDKQLYVSRVGGNILVIDATSHESALAQAKSRADGCSMLPSDVQAHHVSLATAEDIAWYEAMSGPLTPAQAQAFQAQTQPQESFSVPVTRVAAAPKLPVAAAPRGPWNASEPMTEAQANIVEGLAATIHNVRHISASVNGSVCIHIGNGDGDYSQDQSFVVMPSGEVRHNAPVKARPMGPNKKASPNCQSGGRDYCTCDICF